MADAPKKPVDRSFAFLAPPERPDEIGRLADYRVLKLLGRGGMGMVFKAEDTQLERAIALKVMLPKIAADRTARERFLREARAAASLEHDHIIAIHRVGEDRGVLFIAMPFLKGMNLEDWLKQKRTLKIPQILRIGREIARGLQAAHDRGLVHRDIKPANLWLDAATNGRIKILDFGLARPEREDASLTRSGQVVGSPNYMSPEQAEGRTVDARSDLFSLGIVLYRLCTGVLPFGGPNIMAVLMALATQDPPAAVTLNPEVPAAFSDLIARLMRKKPEERPASAKEVVDAISAIERERAHLARTGLDIAPRTIAADLARTAAAQTFNFDDSDDSLLSADELEAAHRVKEPQTEAMRPTWLWPAIFGGGAALTVAVVAVVSLLAMSRPDDKPQIVPPTNPLPKIAEAPKKQVELPMIPTHPIEPAPTPKKVVDVPPVPSPKPPTPIVAKERPLFNGKDLTGWKYEPKTWRVENGEIIGESTFLPASHEIVAPGRYGDFLLTFEAKSKRTGYDMLHLLLRFDATQVDGEKQEPRAIAVGMSTPGNIDEVRGWSFKAIRMASPAMQKARKTDDWNSFAVRFVGGRMTVRVNDAEFDAVDAPAAGDVRLTWHTGPRAPELRVRNIRIQELKPPMFGEWDNYLAGGKLDKWWVHNNELKLQPKDQPKDDSKGISVSTAGEPAVRFVTDKARDNYVSTRRTFAGHHLRFEFQLQPGPKDPQLAVGPSTGADFGCMFNISTKQSPSINLWWGQAVEGFVENGIIVAKKNASKNLRFTKQPPTKLTKDNETEWHRLDVVRLDGGMIYFLDNGFVGALADLRLQTKDKVTDLGPTAINLYVNSGNVNVRRVQIREISALPPEILELAR